MTIQILLAALFHAAVLWLGFRAAPEAAGAAGTRDPVGALETVDAAESLDAGSAGTAFA